MGTLVDRQSLNNAREEKLQHLEAISIKTIRDSRTRRESSDNGSFMILDDMGRSMHVEVTYASEIYVKLPASLECANQLASAYQKNGWGPFIIVRDWQ